MVEELEEKRCLSFQHCPREAKAYYRTKNGEKGVCAAWAESFCFGRSTMIDDLEGIKEHHTYSREKVNGNKRIKNECRQIAMDLAKCLQGNRR